MGVGSGTRVGTGTGSGPYTTLYVLQMRTICMTTYLITYMTYLIRNNRTAAIEYEMRVRDAQRKVTVTDSCSWSWSAIELYQEMLDGGFAA
jgi:hypothetical protein